MKPFKPPSLIRKFSGDGPKRPAPPALPTAKKRRTNESLHEDGGESDIIAATAKVLQCQPNSTRKFVPPGRKPLDTLANSSSPSQQSSQSENGFEAYYNVLWRRFNTKKNKTWDGDGVLLVSNGYATLKDLFGKDLGKTTCRSPLDVGSQLSVAGREVEVDSVLSKDEFLAGRPFLNGVKEASLPHVSAPFTKQISQTENIRSGNQERLQRHAVPKKQKPPAQATVAYAPPAAFKNPLLNDVAQLPNKGRNSPVPRHDPHATGALVMKRPRDVPKGRQIVDVVVDPLLTKRLREHQRIGVSFLYECVMGMKDYVGEGAILADEMGLGKTLQTIALLWTLMKQNPVYDEPPVVKKALIVCPVTLINNWRKEINKWLGRDRLGVFIPGNKYTRLTDFTKGKTYRVMIIGYEKLRMIQADLQKGSGIDIVIADEGHRLKTAQNKAAMAIKSLNTERRIILSGTPLQNDLTEFYTMVDFVNPGLLSKYSTFRREFEIPILKSQQPGASSKDLEVGTGRSEELANITGKFILRRTGEILAKYLPSKTEYVVFCKPTKAQVAVYRSIIESPVFGAALGSPALSLELITVLKKVCNSPTLLLNKGDRNDVVSKPELLDCVPISLLRSPGSSGKLQVLDSLLHQIRTTTDEKVVIVSNYTSTLDVLEKLLTSLSYNFLRLDGTTPPAKRQPLVDQFNRSSAHDSFVFLLSAKAGGLGLNLIGASRLILYDLDWNPATDLQAMSRVHRDGQKRPCFIYRLLTQGALDEKIFQRQVSKTGLAESVVDGKNGVSGFTREELRDIFSLDEGNECQTHRLLGCFCGGNGTPVTLPEDSEDEDTSRNDLAALCRETRAPDQHDGGVEVLHLDDDDEVLRWKKRCQFQTANQYDWESEEARIQRGATEDRVANRKLKMQSLLQYTHFDSSFAERCSADKEIMASDCEDEEALDHVSVPDLLDTVIEDAALRTVIREDRKPIGFVFTKLSI